MEDPRARAWGERTSDFFRNLQNLIPRRHVPVAEHSLIPLLKVKGRNDELGHILRICERDLIVACAWYARGLVGHVNSECNGLHVALNMRNAVVIHKVAVVEPCPFEVCLLQLGEDGLAGRVLWELEISVGV